MPNHKNTTRVPYLRRLLLLANSPITLVLAIAYVVYLFSLHVQLFPAIGLAVVGILALALLAASFRTIKADAIVNLTGDALGHSDTPLGIHEDKSYVFGKKDDFYELTEDRHASIYQYAILNYARHQWWLESLSSEVILKKNGIEYHRCSLKKLEQIKINIMGAYEVGFEIE